MGRWVHVLSEVDIESKTGICRECGPITISIHGKNGKPRCPTARMEHAGPNKGRRSRHHGLTNEERESFLASACEICGTTESLCVDHDHSSKELRGTLCMKCNAGLGLFKDSPDLLLKAIEYLKKP